MVNPAKHQRHMPRNPGADLCLCWKKRGFCLQLEQNGHCPFSHPPAGSEELSKKEVGAIDDKGCV